MTAEMPDRVDQSSPPPWIGYDSFMIGALIIVAAIQHFWRLQLPGILVYDEHVYVEEAYKYLGGRVFFEVHPPLAITLIVACAWLFGCHSWSWRISSALAGTALIPITYLLARRMFKSRVAATLSAVLMLCEGMFMEYSRLALINIIYLTLAAAAYLALFRFMQVREVRDRRRTLTWMGVALGLGLGSKLAIPGIAWLLTVGFLLATLLMMATARTSIADWWSSLDLRYTTGALVLVGSVSALFFVLTFLPNYLVGWWSGVASITTYYHHVMMVNRTYPAPVSHQDSPWWSWPLMMRAYNYSQQQDDMGNYLTIWGGGNPAIWWAALVAIVLAAIRALRRDGLAWRFLVLGYLMYTAMWIPVTRALYLYSYMPAFYLGILALAGLLACCWDGTAAIWEQVSLMLPVIAVALFGLGFVYGAIASSVMLGSFIALLLLNNLRSNLRGWSGRFVCVVFVAVAAVVFIYFLPLWIPLPLSESQLQARMWFNSAGVGDWM